MCATAAGMDAAFEDVFVLLAGGDLTKVVTGGQREAAQLKNQLAERGYSGQKLHELLYRVEPNRLAHRLDAKHLWLYSALYDTTVPPEHSDSLAAAAGLPEHHHTRMPATHYSGVVFLPMILDDIAVKAGGHRFVVSGSNSAPAAQTRTGAATTESRKDVPEP